MTKMRIMSVMTAFALAIALFTAVASAANGVAVVFGTVTLGGVAAPAGTVVNIAKADGTVLGSAATGANGQSANGYRIDLQVSDANGLDGVTANVNVANANQSIQATVVVKANTATQVNLTAVAGPTPTATAAPQPTASANVQATQVAQAVASVVASLSSNPPSSIIGKNGTNGTNGANGANGAVGAAGPAGPAGVAGAAGPAGAAGKVGAEGKAASSGLVWLALIIAVVALVAGGYGAMKAGSK